MPLLDDDERWPGGQEVAGSNPAGPTSVDTTGRETTSPAPPPPPVPPPPPPPMSHRRPRHPWRWVIAWGVAVVVVAGLLVPAVIATRAAGRVADAGFERYVQLDPGSTSTYATTTN